MASWSACYWHKSTILVWRTDQTESNKCSDIDRSKWFNIIVETSVHTTKSTQKNAH